MARNHALAVAETESKAAACVRLPVARYEGGGFSVRDDAIIQEQELSVFVNGTWARDITCSPWDVEELVAGSLFLSGDVERRADLRFIDVDLGAGVASASVREPKQAMRGIKALRNGGVVLTGVFSAGERELLRPVSSPMAVPAQAVVEHMAFLEDRSHLFHRTGGVHSAVLADEGGVIAWFEDIGRHSALDKLAGWCFLDDVDVSNAMLLFSGRVPREIIVKAIRLGCPVIASPGAPTSLSIELAQKWGVTLVGFAKRGAFNVYAHPERIV